MIDFDALLLPVVRDTFGEQVTVARQVGNLSVPVSGVFQDAYVAEAFGSDGPSHITVAPNVGVRIADVGWEPKQGDTVTRAKTGVRYEVVEHRPDGLGWTSLVLKVRKAGT